MSTLKKRIGPLFSYYGSKWRIAGRYPEPEHDIIVEPFAGGSGYSQMYPWKKVILYEPYEPLYRAWKFLIGATKDDILSLPLLEPGQRVSGLDIPQGAKDFIGYWVGYGRQHPGDILSPKGVRNLLSDGVNTWTSRNRERISDFVASIKHWEIYNESYECAPDIEATWFIDPPYEKAGYVYPLSDLDYDALSKWCKTRKGLVMVCEADEANWLPFEKLAEFGSNRSKSRSWKELIWVNRTNG